MKELKALLQIKKIIAILLTFVFMCLCFKGLVDAQNFIAIYMTIIGFYFGQSTARNSRKDAE